MSALIFERVTSILFIINLIFAIVVVFLERRNPSTTWSWLMILYFIPLLGFVLYLFMGQDLRKKKLFKLKKEEELALYTILPKQSNINFLINTPHPNELVLKHSDFIRLNLNCDNASYTENNKIEIIDDGVKKFEALKKSLLEAEHFIHIQYYIFRNDGIGREIMDILKAKALKGVEVKLIYDGMGCIRTPNKFFAELSHCGGEIAEFFPPFLPYMNLRVNYRNHRKICVIDGVKAFIGGFNIGDEYSGFTKRFGYWRDTHLYIEGEAVDSLELRFLMDWSYASNSTFNYIERYFPKKQSFGASIGIQIVSSGPDSHYSNIRNSYLDLISRAKSSIYIETPYFIPDDSILTALKVAALSGVEVNIIVPEKKDHPFIKWASLSYLGELIEVGVNCYYYQKGFVHSKLIMIDEELFSIGTANMDIRSFNLNFEVNAFIFDECNAKLLKEMLLCDINKSIKLTKEQYQFRSLLVKFKEGVCRLLSPML